MTDLAGEQRGGWAQSEAGEGGEKDHTEKVLECGLRRLALAQQSMKERSASNPSSISGGLSWQLLNSTFQLTCCECPVFARPWPRC